MKRTTSRLSRVLPIVLSLSLLAAACGGDGGPGPRETTPPAVDRSALETRGPNGEQPTASDRVQLSEEEEEQVRRGGFKAALLWHTQAAFTEAVSQGVHDVFEDLGVEIVAETNAEFDAAKQANDVETVMALDPDIIITLVIDPVAGAEAFRQAVDAGVKLVFLSNVPDGYEHGRDYVGIVTDDLAGMGKAAAELLGDAMGGEGKVGWMFHDAEYYVTNQRDNAFKAWVTERYDGIEIVAEEGVADPAKAEEVASAMITRNPEITGIYAPWATPAEGVLSALRAAGRDDVSLVTLDLDPTIAIDMVQDGNTIGIVADLAYDLGRTMAIEGAYGVLDKEAPPFTIVPAIKVTEDNLVDGWRRSLAQDPPREVTQALGG